MNGRLFIMYVTESAGIFRIEGGGEEDLRRRYERATETGILDVPRYDIDRPESDEVRVVFVSLVEVKENFDMKLGRSRG